MTTLQKLFSRQEIPLGSPNGSRDPRGLASFQVSTSTGSPKTNQSPARLDREETASHGSESSMWDQFRTRLDSIPIPTPTDVTQNNWVIPTNDQCLNSVEGE